MKALSSSLILAASVALASPAPAAANEATGQVSIRVVIPPALDAIQAQQAGALNVESVFRSQAGFMIRTDGPARGQPGQVRLYTMPGYEAALDLDAGASNEAARSAPSVTAPAGRTLRSTDYALPAASVSERRSDAVRVTVRGL